MLPLRRKEKKTLLLRFMAGDDFLYMQRLLNMQHSTSWPSDFTAYFQLSILTPKPQTPGAFPSGCFILSPTNSLYHIVIHREFLWILALTSKTWWEFHFLHQHFHITWLCAYHSYGLHGIHQTPEPECLYILRLWVWNIGEMPAGKYNCGR